MCAKQRPRNTGTGFGRRDTADSAEILTGRVHCQHLGHNIHPVKRRRKGGSTMMEESCAHHGKHLMSFNHLETKILAKTYNV